MKNKIEQRDHTPETSELIWENDLTFLNEINHQLDRLEFTF